MFEDWLESDDLLERVIPGANPAWRDRMRSYAASGIRLLTLLEDELIAELGFTGEAARRLKDDELVGFALAMAYMAGINAGRAELGGEAQDRGIYLPADLVTPPALE